METIKEMVNQFHDNAVSKGFYELPNTILDKMSFENECVNFTDEERKAVKDAFIAQRLMLITSELGEALEANRKPYIQAVSIDDSLALTSKNDDEFIESFKTNVKDSFQDELSDVAIRLFDLAGWLNIDLQKHIELKHRYNTTREKMHGKKY